MEFSNYSNLKIQLSGVTLMHRYSVRPVRTLHHPRLLITVGSLLAALLTLSIVLILATVQAQADHSAHAATAFVAHDYSFEGPSELAAGWQNILLRNDGAELHHLQFARLNDDVTTEQFFQVLQEQGEAALALGTLTGGVGIIPPGAEAEVMVDFTQPGTYVLLCFVENAEGVPHLALGMTDVLQVVGEAAASTEPTADIEVRMHDFAFTMPTSVPTGEHVWKVVNDGPQPHEMALVKLNEGVSFEQFMEGVAAGGEGAMPGTPIGGAQALGANLASYITYDLEPGTYVALCYVPDPESGQPHLALGMVASFMVEAPQAGN